MKLDVYEQELILIAKELAGYLVKTGANLQDAQDIAQDALVKLLEIEDQLTIRQLRPWFFRVGINLYHNLYNRKKRYQEILRDEVYPQLNEVRAEVDYETFYRALAELDGKAVELLLMKYEQRMSFKEIGFILNRPAESLKTELYRTRQSIKAIIERQEASDGTKR